MDGLTIFAPLPTVQSSRIKMERRKVDSPFFVRTGRQSPQVLTVSDRASIYRNGPAGNQVNPIRKFLITSLRLLATAGLLWALAARVDLSRAAQIMGHASLPLLAAALLAQLAASLITGFRWHIILSAEAPSPGPGALLKIVLVGLFFNQVLPTGIGGDAVRAWRCRKLGIGLGAAVRSILLDRACGYLVLVVLYAASLPILLQVLPDARQRDGVVAVFAAALFGLLGLLSLDQLPRRMLRHRAIAPLAELSRASRRLFTHPRHCSAVLGLSVCTMGLTILGFKLVGDAVGSRLSLESWAMIVPPVSLIQLLPVSLAGWGVREVVLVVALASFGIPAEAALATSVLMGVCLVIVGLPGGLVWLADWDVARSGDPGARKAIG
jgi:glycosyltransferase 2 family protein